MSELVFGETRVTIPKRQLSFCAHKEVEMCKKIQLLKCTACGELLTAWWFLEKHVMDFKTTTEQLNIMKCEIELKRRLIAQLRRAEINTKNRIKTAKKKV